MRGGDRAAVSMRAAGGGMGTNPIRELEAGIVAQLEESYGRLQGERGMCSIGGPRYSPDEVRLIALDPAQGGGWPYVAGRVVEIVTGTVGFALALAGDALTGRGAEKETVQRRASQVRELLVSLGPSFIKVGQALANRPDIVREDYMQELCLLQDQVPFFDNDDAMKILTEELGRPLDEVFSYLSPEPVAAASLGQVYRATLRDGRGEVAVKVQRPNTRQMVYADLAIFQIVAVWLNEISIARLGCDAELILGEFAEKLLEELDYRQEARNGEDFRLNFLNDPNVFIPRTYADLCTERVLVMEWVNGVRVTDLIAGNLPESVKSTINIDTFVTVGVMSALRQLLEFGLFHGDPHPGNLFAMPDGRIAYIDFGNVAELSQTSKQTLIDAVVHVINDDYDEVANDFVRLGFLSPGTDITPIVPAMALIWRESKGKSMQDFNFRTVTAGYNELVYNYPIRIPERFSLVIRSLLIQESICLSLDPNFKFLEVAYPYVAKRLLTDDNPALRERLIEVLFKNDKFQWERLETLVELALNNRIDGVRPSGAGSMAQPALVQGRLERETAKNQNRLGAGRGVRMQSNAEAFTDTILDGATYLLSGEAAALRLKLLLAFTDDDRLHTDEVARIVQMLGKDFNADTLREIAPKVLQKLQTDVLPTLLGAGQGGARGRAPAVPPFPTLPGPASFPGGPARRGGPLPTVAEIEAALRERGPAALPAVLLGNFSALLGPGGDT